MPGLNFPLSPSVTMNVGYRYFASDKPTFNLDNYQTKVGYTTNDSQVGLRYTY